MHNPDGLEVMRLHLVPAFVMAVHCDLA